MISSSELQIILISLRASFLAILIILPLGVFVAWIITKTDFKGKFFLELISSLPLALPPVVTGYFLLWILGSGSITGRYIEIIFSDNLAFTWISTILAAAVVSFPLSVGSFTVAFQSVDPNLEQCARGLGANNIKIFFTITLPLSLKGVFAGLILGFARAFSEFGATIIVAGNIPGETSTVPLSIYSNIIIGDSESATRLILVSIFIATITLVVHNRLIHIGTKQK